MMRLTKNFMVNDETALIYWIQLITGLESSTLFSDLIVLIVSDSQMFYVLHCVGHPRPGALHYTVNYTTLQGGKTKQTSQ